GEPHCGSRHPRAQQPARVPHRRRCGRPPRRLDRWSRSPGATRQGPGAALGSGAQTDVGGSSDGDSVRGVSGHQLRADPGELRGGTAGQRGGAGDDDRGGSGGGDVEREGGGVGAVPGEEAVGADQRGEAGPVSGGADQGAGAAEAEHRARGSDEDLSDALPVLLVHLHHHGLRRNLRLLLTAVDVGPTLWCTRTRGACSLLHRQPQSMS
ncbi:hypothetical protein MUK42_19212, partial [Musa troglodytarum]